MKKFKSEMENRIENVGRAAIPDFGNNLDLFEEQKRATSLNSLPKSNWSVIYDAIRHYPRFERM